MMNFLSVVLLTYNHEKTIAKAIDSILEQKTSFDFDIHILDDHSTDGTTKICEQYKANFPEKIKVFTNEKNLGVAKNVKQGLLRISSTYYAFLEGDDYWCNPNKLQKQADLLEKNPDCTLCSHDSFFKNLLTGEETRFSTRNNLVVKKIYTIDDPIQMHISSRLYRNCIDLKNVPEHMFQIWDTNSMYIYLAAGNLVYIDEAMSLYNWTGDGIWSGLNAFERRVMMLKIRYDISKYFNFAYEKKFYAKSKLLRFSKLLFGVRAGWFVFYHLEMLRLNIKNLFKR